MASRGDPPGCDHGSVAGHGGDLGNDGEGPYRARVSCRVVSLGNDAVDTGFELSLGLSRLSDETEDQHVAFVGGIEDKGRTSESRGDERNALIEEDVELRSAQFLVEPAPLVEGNGFLGIRDVVLFLDVLGEGVVLFGDFREQLVEGGRGGDRRGEHEVHAEGLAINPLSDPLDVRGDVVRRVHRLAEDREAPGVDDRDGHVLAVGEGNDGEFDSQHLAEPGS